MSAGILIFGADGQVGYELQRQGSETVIALTRKDLDLTDENRVRESIRNAAPRVVVNAAAYTAVDRAESEPELAHAVNGIAPRIMAQEAARCGALMIHYSTDYVFSGEKPEAYVEEDATGPINVYGRTKLAGEEGVRECCARHLILRTSWVFSARGQNFVRTMLRLGTDREQLRVVGDQHGVPTSAAALARATWQAIESWRSADTASRAKLCGLYHATGGPATSWHAFATTIFQRAHQLGIPLQVQHVAAITTAEYPTPAMRPKNSVLCAQKMQDRLGIEVRDWRDELNDVLKEIRATAMTVGPASLQSE